MIDFSIHMTRNVKESLSALERAGFRYLSADGHSFLERISDNLIMALEQNERSLFASLKDNQKETNDKKWVSILNSKENWVRFKKYKTQAEIIDINMFHQFWVSQNQFALASNKSLIESHKIIIFYLNHVKAALKEYEKDKNNLDMEFIKIHTLNERLKNAKGQLTNAMLVRLKIAHNYSNRGNQPIADVDDVVYYISNGLNNRNALNPDEQKILPTKPQQTFAAESKNYYVQFYDFVKMHGESVEEKSQIDAFHWSKIINKPVFHLSNSRTKHDFIISVPTFLYRFVPKNYQTPSWWYWQDNATLKFWEKRQDFIVNLDRLWTDENNANNQKPLTKSENEAKKEKKEKCVALINAELAKIISENPSFFAFAYKEMLKEWELILKSMRSDLLQAIRSIEATAHVSVTHKNMNQVDKKDDGAKKTQSKENSKSNILEVIKQSENEYQDFMSDDLHTHLNNPKISVNTDWKDSRKSSRVTVGQAERFSINGSQKDHALSKKQNAKRLLPSVNKVSHKLIGRVY